MISRWLRDDVLEKVQLLKPLAEHGAGSHGPARGRLGAAEPERSCSAIVGATRPGAGPDNAGGRRARS
jgi:hypothetical protein